MPLKNTREVPVGPAARGARRAPAPRRPAQRVIAQYLKTLPGSPGVYRMLDAAGTVIYVGKARNLKARVTNYARAGNHTNRIARMIATTAAMEFVTVRTEAEALLLEANLIKRFRPRYNVLLRDDKSFPYILIASDHRGAADPEASRRAQPQGRLLRPVRLRRRRQPHHQHAGARLPAALLLGRRVREPHAALPAVPDQALLGALHRRDRPRGLRRRWSRRRCASCAARARTCAQMYQRLMQEAADQLDFEQAAKYRNRLWALAHVTADQAINPEGIEEADVFAAHQDGGQTCVQVFFFRAGQNWGNRAYFPRADRSRSAWRRCWRASSPSSTTTSRCRG